MVFECSKKINVGYLSMKTVRLFRIFFSSLDMNYVHFLSKFLGKKIVQLWLNCLADEWISISIFSIFLFPVQAVMSSSLVFQNGHQWLFNAHSFLPGFWSY